MRGVSLCLVTLFVCAACYYVMPFITTEPETTIQVQGTVTAADDGSPIAGASVEVGEFLSDQKTQVQTNNQGDYSLLYTGGCSPKPSSAFLRAQTVFSR